ncbi:hypothetical protein L935_01265 [Helicobacter pylori PZ5086]|nr:hypothetical protein L935_01265 [Helicobacter pylori PZ5086]
MVLKIIHKTLKGIFTTNNQGLDFDQAITFINIFLN